MLNYIATMWDKGCTAVDIKKGSVCWRCLFDFLCGKGCMLPVMAATTFV